jgi:hypothetical protein
MGADGRKVFISAILSIPRFLATGLDVTGKEEEWRESKGVTKGKSKEETKGEAGREPISIAWVVPLRWCKRTRVIDHRPFWDGIHGAHRVKEEPSGCTMAWKSWEPEGIKGQSFSSRATTWTLARATWNRRRALDVDEPPIDAMKDFKDGGYVDMMRHYTEDLRM